MYISLTGKSVNRIQLVLGYYHIKAPKLLLINKIKIISRTKITRAIWLKTWSWHENPLRMESGRLKFVFSKRCASKNEMRSVRSDLKKLDSFNHRKNTLSPIFCATGVWGLSCRPLDFFSENLLNKIFNLIQNCLKHSIFEQIWGGRTLSRTTLRMFQDHPGAPESTVLFYSFGLDFFIIQS